MNLYYEEAGAFKVGKVLQEQGNAYQVETLHGKRTKVKANSVMVSFRDMDCHDFARAVDSIASEVDTELLWECAPPEEFGFEEMAELYFGERPSPAQQAGVLSALHAAPVYFHRKGKGRYRAAPEDILRAALAGLEKKRRLAEQQDAMAAALVNRQLPEEIKACAAQLLARPDKNTMEYKALMQACSEAGMSPEILLMECGAFDSVHSLMREKFVCIHFPRGIESRLQAPEMPAEIDKLPLAQVQAFSIDDSSTTEIDDAFSVTMLSEERARVGVHIAAPSLWIARGSEYDKLARDRMSTVYSPGEKITMLPDALVEQATLAEGSTVPALSLYVEVDLATGEPCSDPASLVERVPVAANLRHNLLDEVLTREVLEDSSLVLDHPVQAQLAGLRVLWKASNWLRAQREAVRGQPEKHSRIDFSFNVSEDGHIEIRPRRRDAPLDLLVAEWMIFVNCQWGGFLAQHQTTGIYRVQPPMGRVRMSTHASAHAGLGVPQYAWSTSPLRRYVDLINQQQLISVIRGQPAVYSPTDSDLLSAVNGFDITYKAYAEYQSNMERYWCLRWIRQEGRKRMDGVVVRDELVRLHEIPLFVRLVGVTSPGRGAQVEVELDHIDEITLTVSCKLISIQSGKPTLLLEDEDLEETEAEPNIPEIIVAEDSSPDAGSVTEKAGQD